MLKATAASIAPSLTTLFKLSLKSGTFPDDWKLVHVIPVPKGSDSTLPTNYRPISILSILSKLIERHVYRILFEHLRTCYTISSRQWGFLPGSSKALALLCVTHDWLNQLDNGHEVYSVYFDIKKAFDSVHHDLLLLRLAEIHVDPYII